MQRFMVPVVVVVAILAGGCGGDPDAPQPLDAMRVMQLKFDPPESGRLDEELLDRYVGVIDAQRDHLMQNNGARFLGPPPDDLTENQLKARRRFLSEALTQAEMARGMPMSEFNWIKQRLARVQIMENRGVEAGTEDAAEVALVKRYEDETGYDLLEPAGGVPAPAAAP